MSDTIEFAAILDTGDFDAGMEIMTGALREIGTIAVDALLSAGAAVADFVGNSFAGALEAEQGFARLTAQLEAQGDAAAITADQASELADQYAHLAGGSDDAIIAAEAVLLKFTQIGGETFPQAIETSADLAALMGTDVATAAQTLGLALDDPTNSLARLAKNTGAFTDEEQEQIKAMALAGDVAGAQALILSNLDEAIGGTAATLAATTAGQWTIFTETIADAGESVASAFLPPLNTLMQTVLIPLIPVIQEVATAFGVFFSTLLSGDITAAIDGLVEFDSVRAIFDAVGLSGQSFYQTTQAIGDFIATNWPIMQATFETVFTTIGGVMQVLSDFVTLTLLPAISQIWLQSGAQLPTAQSTFEGVMAAIVVATQMVSDFITTVLVPVLTAAVDWVVVNWPAIQATIEAVWAAMQVIFDIAVAYLTNVVIPIFASVVSWVVTNWPTIQATVEAVMAAVSAVVTSVLNAVVPFALAMFAQIKSWVDTNWPLIQATIETVINAISSVITSVISSVTSFWTDNQDTILAVASAVWENIKISIENAILLIQGIITTVMQVITGDWEGAWETVKMTANAIWENIQEAIGNSIEAVSAIISSVMAGLNTAWTSAWNSVKTTISSTLTGILTTVQTSISNMINAFMGTDWASVGSNVINSISGAISNAAGSLAQSAADAAYAAYQAMLNALGIGSPSKLFAGIGENVMLSMSASMDKHGKSVVQSAQSVATRMVNPVQRAAQVINNKSSVSRTDARQFIMNATTQKPIQTLQAEFATMQVIASLPA